METLEEAVRWMVNTRQNGNTYSQEHLQQEYASLLTEIEGKMLNLSQKNQEIIKLALQGTAQAEIGRRMQLSRETIRVILRKKGFHALWKENKQYRTAQMKDGRSKLLAVLEIRAKQELQGIHEDNIDEWSHKKAIEHQLKVKSYDQKEGPNFHILKRIYRIYRESQLSGNKLSFKDIGDQVDKDPRYIMRVLSRTGLPSLTRTIEHTSRLTQKQKSILKNATRLPLSDKDIGYFLGISNIPIMKYRDHRIPPAARGHLEYLEGNQKLNYRSVSQIREAQDAGFTPSEISELLGVKWQSVFYVFANKKKLDKKIISFLKVMYPHQKITHPYIKLRSLREY